MSSPLLGRFFNGGGLNGSVNGSVNGSEGSPRRDARERPRWVIKHEKYYMVGGDLYVLIDDVLFKVHSYFFRREARNFFEDTPADDATAAPAGKDAEGRSEEKPIRILDVTVQEFEQFLWVFYNPRFSIYDAPILSWFSILKLAHRWDFPVVKDFALRELRRREREVALVTRIRLYQDYEAPPEYLVPLYAELCARDLTPTEDEAMELGFERMYRVFKARELLRSPVEASDKGPLSPLPEGVTEEATYPIIENVFGLPPYGLTDGGDELAGAAENPHQQETIDDSQAPPKKDGVPTIKTPEQKSKKSRTSKRSTT